MSPYSIIVAHYHVHSSVTSGSAGYGADIGVAVRPSLEMIWPSLDEVKLVGVGLSPNPNEYINQSMNHY